MISNNFLLLLFYGVFILAVLFVGLLINQFIFGVKEENFVRKLTFGFATGNIFYSFVFIILGIFGLLNSGILLLFYLTPLPLIGIKLLRRRKLKKSWLPLRNLRLPEKIFLGLVALALILVFINLFLFPTSWDPLAYHLVLPKLSLEEGSLVFYNWFPESAYPIGIQSLFAYGEALKDPRLSNFIVFGFLVFIVVYILLGLRKEFARNLPIFAVALFLFRPFLFSETTLTPFIDIPMAFYVLLVLDLFRKFTKGQTDQIFYLLFLLFFITLIKFTGWIIVLSIFIPGAAYILGNKERRKEILQIATKATRIHLRKFLVVMTALSLSIYWLARNYFYTRNPFYPYLDHIFKSIFFNPETYRSTTEVIKTANLLPLNTLKYFLIHPLANIDLLEQYSEIFLLILLFTSCVFMLFSYKDRALKYVSLSVVIYFLFVLFLVGINARRYYLPVLPFLSIIAGIWLTSWLKKRDLRYWVSLGLVFSVFVPQIYLFYHKTKPFLDYTFKKSIKAAMDYNEAKKLLTLQDNYEAIDYLNKNYEGNGKVLVMFDNRLYYLEPPVIYGHPWVFFSEGKEKSPEEVSRELRGLGVSYLLENRNWGYPPGMDVSLYEDFRLNYLEKKFSERGVTIYRFK